MNLNGYSATAAGGYETPAAVFCSGTQQTHELCGYT